MQFYIDPGTGSMLFTMLLGILGAGIYALRNLGMKLRFWLSGGKNTKVQQEALPFVIFSDSKRYWNTFAPICREFEKRGQDVVYMTASPDDPALKEKFEHVKCEFIGEGNRGFARLNLLQADVLLATTPGLDVYQWKRSKNVKYYVHIIHAPNDVYYRMFGLDFFDAVLMSGQFQIDQIRELEQVRNLPAKEMKVVGMPYLDAMLERLRKTEPLAEHPITVLVAPSWGPSSILNRFGSQFIEELLKTGYKIIIRPHPQSYTSEKDLLEKLQKQYPDNEQLQWNDDNDNFDVLNTADIMISDYSGVIFDFSLVFNKPVIYADTSFDRSPYDSWFVDRPLWTFEVLKKIGTKLTPENFREIKEIIDGCLSNPAFQTALEQARIECWENIGYSAALTTEYLINKRQELYSFENEKQLQTDKMSKI